MSTVIKAENLTKNYDKLRALDCINFSIDAGSLFGLLGPNGSGKSTTIKILTGQISASSGSCEVMGISPAKEPIRVREGIGIIPEQETPPSFLTAMEYLLFVASVKKIDNAKENADHWFEFLDFADKKDVLCKDLSRGTKQKLMIAQAFMGDPPLAIIDEPLINLDPIMQRTVKEFLKDYVLRGNTVFISTHILENAEDICTDFAILHKGKILHTGTIAELKARNIRLEDYFIDLLNNSA